MILCYVSYDIVFFIISYECILIRITILVISSGSSGSKCGIIMLLYYTLIGSVFLIYLLLFLHVLIVLKFYDNKLFAAQLLSY